MRWELLLAVLVLGTPAWGEVPAEIKACRALSADKARLACFDAALAKLDAAKPDFGGENLKAAAAPAPVQFQLARIVKVQMNPIGHFIATLDNGQVWRQTDSDTNTAHLRAGDAIKITRGFLDSYSLSIEGAWGSYKVKRIK